MTVQEIMTKHPGTVDPESTIRKAAVEMIDRDCGELPVTDRGLLVGVITDRDLCCRGIAKGLDPNTSTVRECMTTPALSITPDVSIGECQRIMVKNQIRRLPVVTPDGHISGIVSLADIATKCDGLAESLIRHISEPTENASAALR